MKNPVSNKGTLDSKTAERNWKKGGCQLRQQNNYAGTVEIFK